MEGLEKESIRRRRSLVMNPWYPGDPSTTDGRSPVSSCIPRTGKGEARKYDPRE